MDGNDTSTDGIDPRLKTELSSPTKSESGGESGSNSKIVKLSLPSAALAAFAIGTQTHEAFKDCPHRVSHHHMYRTCSNAYQHHQRCLSCMPWCRAVATTACTHCFETNRLCLIAVDAMGKPKGECEMCAADRADGITRKWGCSARYNPDRDDKPTRLTTQANPTADRDPPLRYYFLSANRKTDSVLHSFARQLSYDDRIMKRENGRKFVDDGGYLDAQRQARYRQESKERIQHAEDMKAFTLQARDRYFRTGEWIGGKSADDFAFY